MHRLARTFALAAFALIAAATRPGVALATGHAGHDAGMAVEGTMSGHCDEALAAEEPSPETPSAVAVPATPDRIAAHECCAGPCGGCCVEAPSRQPADALPVVSAGSRDRDEGGWSPTPDGPRACDTPCAPCGRGDLPPPPAPLRLLFASLRL